MLTVTNNNDSGAGSLRAAIAAAAVGEEIQFSITGTITLTSAELFISQSVIITGPGSASLTINGGGAFRCFNTDTGIISISGLTLLNGSGTLGGGLHNEATLTLSDVIVLFCQSSNDGGGIWNSSSIAISNNCAVRICSANGGDGGGIWNTGTIDVAGMEMRGNICTGSGGAIWNDGTVTYAGGEIATNTAYFGGGIANEGTCTLTEVTLDANTSTDGQDAIINTLGTAYLIRSTIKSHLQNGVYNVSGTVSVDNSTISSNGFSGIYNQTGSSVDLQHSTIVNNQIGVTQDAGAILTVQNTILSGNIAIDYGGDTADVTSLGNNIFGKDTNPITPATGDQIILTYAGIVLGPLQNNGGPTDTHALLAGSPAIDAGNSTGAPATDQRGFPRVVGGSIDIGAYESDLPSTCLTFTGTLPAWLSISGDCLIGAAGTYTAATKEEANALAQAALDDFVAEQQDLGNLSCGVVTPCSDRESLTVEGELTIASPQSVLRGPGTFYCYEFLISVEAGKNISIWAGSPNFDVYLYLLDGSTVLAENDSSGYNQPGEFFDNAALNYTPPGSATLTVQATTFAQLEVGTFKVIVADGIESTSGPMEGPWVSIYIPSTDRLFAVGTFETASVGANVYVINGDTEAMTTIPLESPANCSPLLFYNPNDDSVWVGVQSAGAGGGTKRIYRLDPTTGTVLENFTIARQCLFFPAYVPGLNKLFGGKDESVPDSSDKISVYNCTTRLYELPPITVLDTSNVARGVYIPEIDRVVMKSDGSTGYQLINPNDKSVSGYITSDADITYGFYHDGLYYSFEGNGVNTRTIAFDITTGTVSHSILNENHQLFLGYNPCRDCAMLVTSKSHVVSTTSLNLDDFSMIDSVVLADESPREIRWISMPSSTAKNRMYVVFGFDTDDEPLLPGHAYRIA